MAKDLEVYHITLSKKKAKSLRQKRINYQRLTVSLAPFIVNEPSFLDRHIEKATDQRVTFGTWW